MTRTRLMFVSVTVVFGLSVILGLPVAHAVDPADKCEANKLVAAGKYTACLLKGKCSP